MFGFSKEQLSEDERATLIDYKHLIYEAFLLSLTMGVSKDAAAILVDEEFGERIHEEARRQGITRILTVEKSGQDEFEFEYGKLFGEHIEKFSPDFVKALIYYAPQKVWEKEKLKILSDFCREKGYAFLLEVLVKTDGEQKPAFIHQCIQEFQAFGIEPDVWKIEGLENEEKIRKIVTQARAGGRDAVGVIILGRGEDKEKVEKWLQVGSKIPGVIGFAVGRTTWKEPLIDYHRHTASRQEAVHRIASNYKYFIDLFKQSKLKANEAKS